MIDEIIKDMESKGQIDRNDLSTIPFDKPFRKISIWRNDTPIFPRWDAEIWYSDGTQQRIGDVSPSDKRLLSEIIARQE